MDYYDEKMRKILQKTPMPSNKFNICKIGIELGCLNENDIAYIAAPTTSIDDAHRRLHTAIFR